MIALRSSTGDCALTLAAGSVGDPWQPLLLLLRRVAMDPRPCDDQRARMTKVLEMLCKGPGSKSVFDSDKPHDVRDECVRLLLERGACVAHAWCNNPVVSRIICGQAQMARVPQLINKAVVGMAVMRLYQNP